MTRSITLLLAVLLLVALPASAETLALPIQIDLAGLSALELEIWNAEIDLEIRADSAQRLVVRTANSAGLELGAAGATIDFEESGNLVRLRRPRPETGGVKLSLILEISESLAWSLNGREVELSARRAENPSQDADEVAEMGAAQLDLRDSRGDLAGLVGLRIRSEESWLRLARTRGVISLEGHGGEVEIEEHQGNLSLNGEATQWNVRRHAGMLHHELRGGGILVSGGSGEIRGAVSGGASVVYEDWASGGNVMIEDGSIDLRDGGGEVSFEVQAKRSDVRVDRWSGKLVLRLTEGVLQAADLGGRVSLIAAAIPTLDVRDSDALFDINFQDGVSATFSEIRGQVFGSLKDSQAELDGVAQARLALEGSELRGNVDYLINLMAADSEIDLDLSESAFRTPIPHLQLSGSTTARMRLPNPCFATIEGETAADAARASGCDLVLPGHPGRIKRPGQRPFQIKARLSDDATIVIEASAL